MQKRMMSAAMLSATLLVLLICLVLVAIRHFAVKNDGSGVVRFDAKGKGIGADGWEVLDGCVIAPGSYFSFTAELYQSGRVIGINGIDKKIESIWGIRRSVGYVITPTTSISEPQSLEVRWKAGNHANVDVKIAP